MAFLPRYPFVVTVWRKPGGTKPVEQRHSFDDVGVAERKMGEFANDRAVVKTQLAIVLKEVTFHGRLAGVNRPLTIDPEGT